MAFFGELANFSEYEDGDTIWFTKRGLCNGPQNLDRRSAFLGMVGGVENERESMRRTHTSHPPSLKAKVAVEAIKGHKMAAQIAQKFAPTQPKSVVGRDEPWLACRMSSANSTSRSANMPTRRRTNSTADRAMKVELDLFPRPSKRKSHGHKGASPQAPGFIAVFLQSG